MLQALNTQFGVKDAVTFVENAHRFEQAVLTHVSGARLEVLLYGAHVTAWKSARGQELLFVSQESFFEPGRPIRGGIPICFPQFSNNGPLPAHGFARTCFWRVERSGMLPDDRPYLTLALTENVETLKLWPFRFRLALTVQLGEALDLILEAGNSGTTPFRFNTALHTYFQVADIRKTAVIGLDGTTFSDDLRQGAHTTEARPRIDFTGETDRVYLNAPDLVHLRDDGRRQVMTIEKTGMHDIVVWNPWSERAKRMEDLGDEEYRRMVCVETGNMKSAVTLAPGQAWRGTTRLTPA